MIRLTELAKMRSRQPGRIIPTNRFRLSSGQRVRVIASYRSLPLEHPKQDDLDSRTEVVEQHMTTAIDSLQLCESLKQQLIEFCETRGTSERQCVCGEHTSVELAHSLEVEIKSAHRWVFEGFISQLESLYAVEGNPQTAKWNALKAANPFTPEASATELEPNCPHAYQKRIGQALEVLKFHALNLERLQAKIMVERANRQAAFAMTGVVGDVV